MENEEARNNLLVEENLYHTSGVHIGTQQKSADMDQFIFKIRRDGLYVMDVVKTDERIKVAAAFLAQFDRKDILVSSARPYGQKPVTTFARTIGCHVFAGRFVPGTMTNPQVSTFTEPRVIVLTDPATDSQALKEACSIRIPVVAICDANNTFKNVDLVIPGNNKGRKAIAMIYWLLTREVLKARGELERDEDYTLTPEDFEASL